MVSFVFYQFYTMDNDNKPKNQLSIELSDEIAEGIYSNLAIISHSSTDFVLDFIRIVPNTPKAKVKSRVIITPENAKRLLRALKDNITKYESRYGKIEGGDEEDLLLRSL